MLLAQLQHVFGSDVSLQGAALGRLRTEHALLDTTIRSLVAQLNLRSGEWAQVLEAIRGRMDALVAAVLHSHPNAMLQQQAGEALSAAEAAELAGDAAKKNHQVWKAWSTCFLALFRACILPPARAASRESWKEACPAHLSLYTSDEEK